MVAFRKSKGTALRPIMREPRSTDELMANAELMVHNRVGTMVAPNVGSIAFTVPQVAGVPVGPDLGGGVISPLSNRAVRPADQAS